MCIYLLLLSYGHKTSYNTQFACYAQFTGDTPELHQGTYLSNAQVIYSFQLFALISNCSTLSGSQFWNQTGAVLLVLVQLLALALPLLLTLQALVEEPDGTEESHQLTRKYSK